MTRVGATPLSHINRLKSVTCTTGMSSRSAIGCTLSTANGRGALCST
ncbi:hypothetical protein MHOL44478_17290 [Mycobacterium holsaticum DSM 44478]|nr:hypothetical protein [Mycolicibacterium holsaticum DSM 44478 = JCM 12374]